MCCIHCDSLDMRLARVQPVLDADMGESQRVSHLATLPTYLSVPDF